MTDAEYLEIYQNKYGKIDSKEEETYILKCFHEFNSEETEKALISYFSEKIIDDYDGSGLDDNTPDASLKETVKKISIEIDKLVNNSKELSEEEYLEKFNKILGI